jgi:phenylalanyl-tRNA synthetase beta chain
MLFSINALKLIIDWKNLDIAPVIDHLTERGLEIESITSIQPQWSHLIVGKILSIEPVPNSDKLKLCQVFDGEKNCQVVCGGPSLQVNSNYIFAPVGSQVGPITIASRKVFGHLSEGMLCGWEEIGIHLEGMALIDDDFIPGTAIDKEIFQDTIYDINVTPNRPDCLSLIGIARELMAINPSITWRSNTIKMPQVTLDNSLKITVDSDQCSIFFTTIINNVNNYTPLWLKLILQNLGFKSMGLPIDIGNFLLKKYGYPTHCYGPSQIQEPTVKIIDTGIFTGLDNQTYTIHKPTLVLTEKDAIHCIMGVMGSKESSYDGHGSLILEVANFNGNMIRSAVKNLKINSQAGYLFSRWVDGLKAHAVIQEFIGYLYQYNPQLTISYSKNHCDTTINYEKKSFFVACDLFYKTAGYELALEKQMAALATTGFTSQLHKISKNDGTNNYNLGIWVTVPHWRTDMTIQENIIEEITRINGVNQYASQPIGTNPLSHAMGHQEKNWIQQQTLNDFLIHRGYQQVINNSITNDIHENSIKILSLDGALKTSLMGDLIKNCTHSIDKGHRSFKLMETGSIFFYPHGETIAMAGLIHDAHKNQEELFMMARKDLEHLFHHHGQLHHLRLEDGCFNEWYHGTKSCKIFYKNQLVGGLGVVASTILFNHPTVLWEIKTIDIFQDHHTNQSQDYNYNLKSMDISFFTEENINKIMDLLHENFHIYQINIIDIYEKNTTSYTLNIQWKYLDHGDKGNFMDRLTDFLNKNNCQVR